MRNFDNIAGFDHWEMFNLDNDKLVELYLFMDDKINNKDNHKIYLAVQKLSCNNLKLAKMCYMDIRSVLRHKKKYKHISGVVEKCKIDILNILFS